MIWFLGAGSGGHLAPNYAIYQKLNNHKNLRFRFLLTNGKLERSYSQIGNYLPIIIALIVSYQEVLYKKFSKLRSVSSRLFGIFLLMSRT